MTKRETTDVVVIGGGSSAFEAAIAAREAGAGKVVMLEKAPPDQAGGNARFSHTGFRFTHSGKDEIRQFIPDVDEDLFRSMVVAPYSAEEFMADLNRVTQGRIDQVLARHLVERSNEAVHWMREIGMKWVPDKAVTVDGKRYYEPGGCLQPRGGGRGQLEQWRAIADRMGIEIRFNSCAAGFLGDEHAVSGVTVSTREGQYDIEARAVIACSGGFQANAEMRARYLGPNSDLVKVRGSRHNTGEVLRMMLDLGARSAGHWQVAHASPIDAGAPDVETPLGEGGRSNTANRYDYRFGLTINTRGERFFDEGEGLIAYTYAKLGREVLAQPGATAYQIYDDTGIGLFRHGRDYPATYEEAHSLPELARKIGMAPEVLVDTVERFNRSIRSDLPFDPTRLDGRGTQGLHPPKTNWAMAIERAPFRAYPVACGITFTFGGVAVNTRSEVINTLGYPIRGLYASGDVVGLFYFNYPSLTGQTRNVVFSIEAGRNAAALKR